jgi:hypothetical protein
VLFPLAGCLKDTFPLISPFDPVIHLRSLGAIPTIMFIQPVNDFRPFHAFLQEELDNISLVHFRDK